MSSWIMNRRLSRLFAVQWAFCFFSDGIVEVEQLCAVFNKFSEDEEKYGYDEGLYYYLKNNIEGHHDEYDAVIKGHSIDSWFFERFDLILLCIIRAAVCEMMCSTQENKPVAAVIVNEYVTLSSCFVDTHQVKFVNAILDKLSASILNNPPSSQ